MATIETLPQGLATGDSPQFTNLTLSGGQLAFPATQSASSGVNTLDDYEEGTWTPVLTTDGTDFTSVTYDAIRNGYYTKIGRLVYICFSLRTDAITKGSASGNVTLTGIPFASADLGSNDASGSIVEALSFLDDVPSGAIMYNNTSRIYLSYRDASDGEIAYLQVADIGTGANANYMSGSLSYIAAT